MKLETKGLQLEMLEQDTRARLVTLKGRP